MTTRRNGSTLGSPVQSRCRGYIQTIRVYLTIGWFCDRRMPLRALCHSFVCRSMTHQASPRTVSALPPSSLPDLG